MKRFFASLATAAVVVGAMAVPAQAAPADPVKVLKAQLVVGKGVKVTETSSITLDFTSNDQAMQVKVTTRSVGTLGFGKGRVTAADLRVSHSSRPALRRLPYRVVAVGRNAYVTNSGIAKALPSGRSWIQSRADGANPLLGTGVTPEDLKFMLGKSSEVATGEYEGSATLAEYRHNKSAGEGTVEFHLYFDKNNLLTRAVVDSTALADEDSTAYDQMAFHTDTTFSHWGAKVAIVAPPASKVVNEKQLNAKTRKAVVKAGYPENGPV